MQEEIFGRFKKSVATNPQAKGQTKISFQISEEEKAQLQRLADASGMKLSAYIRQVLLDALSQGVVFSTKRLPVYPPLQAAAEDQARYDEGNDKTA